jgi:hypothetical protein
VIATELLIYTIALYEVFDSGKGLLSSELSQLAPSLQAPFSPPFQMNVPEAPYKEHRETTAKTTKPRITLMATFIFISR